MTTETEGKLLAAMKTAMREKDKTALGAIRMVRAKISEQRTAKNAKELDEDGIVALIRSYTKGLQGAIEDFRKGGTADEDPAIADLLAEMAVLDVFLPQMLDEAATATIVKAVIAEHGLAGPKAIGRVMGLVMKDHKGLVDANVVKRIAAGALGA